MGERKGVRDLLHLLAAKQRPRKSPVASQVLAMDGKDRYVRTGCVSVIIVSDPSVTEVSLRNNSNNAVLRESNLNIPCQSGGVMMIVVQSQPFLLWTLGFTRDQHSHKVIIQRFFFFFF